MADKKLIEDFLSNKCTPQEAETVSRYLESHPEELNKYLSEEECAAEQGKLPVELSVAWLQQIRHRAFAERPRLRWLRPAMAAAGILLVICLGWYFLQRPKTMVTTAYNVPPPIAPEKIERLENLTARVMDLELPDGSKIQLFTRSSIEYSKTFTKEAERSIYLKGKASFDVAKNKHQVFTVYSGGIVTTALGTSFIVRAYETEDSISVQLYSGKVMVKSPVFESQTFHTSILLPGKELIYNKASMVANVRNFGTSMYEGFVKAGAENNKPLTKPDWYNFKNQPLEKVLEQLSVYYGVAIYYRPSDIEHIYVEGTFLKTDSLEKILTDIILPNQLTIIRDKDNLIIKKAL